MTAKKITLLLALPLLFGGTVILLLLNWHVPTHVRMTLLVRDVVFTVGEGGTIPFLKDVSLSEINIANFASIEVRPETAFIKSAAERATRRVSDASGWSPLRDSGTDLTIHGKEKRHQSNVSLSTPGAGDELGLDPIWISPSSEVTIEKHEDNERLTVSISNQKSSGKISAKGDVLLFVNQCTMEGWGYAGEAPSVKLKLRLRSGSLLRFEGVPETEWTRADLSLSLHIPDAKLGDVVAAKDRIPVTALRFEEQQAYTGNAITSLAGDGELAYPDYVDKIGKVAIRSSDCLDLNSLRKFSIESLKATHQGILLELEGDAGVIRVGPKGYQKDLRLTGYDTVWRSHQLPALFVVVIWIVGTSAAVLKTYKELRK